MPQRVPDFRSALGSDGPAAGRAEKLALYAWLVGRWELDVVLRRPDGSTERKAGFVSAGWVLEGRAVRTSLPCQDSSMARRSEPTIPISTPGIATGRTLCTRCTSR